jgi:hypothetical protein
MLLTIKVELILDSGSVRQCTVLNITGAIRRPLPRRAPGLVHKIFDEPEKMRQWPVL